MPWLTLSQAAQRWLTQAEWTQRVESGLAESYVDGLGRRRVWVDPQDPVVGALSGLRGELLRLRAEVERLRGEAAGSESRGAFPGSTPAPEPRAASQAASRTGSGGLRRLPPPPLPRIDPPCEPVGDDPLDEVPLQPESLPGGGPSPQVAALLAQVDARWGGSDRELERRAGLPLRFLTKARRGERNGERAQESWERLETFLRSFRRAAA